MRPLIVGLILGLSGVLGATAEPANTRTATMPFEECLAIIAETAQEIGEEPVRLVSSADEVAVRINASDGFVTVSCSRPDNRMVLSKSPVPAAAGLSAAAEQPAPQNAE